MYYNYSSSSIINLTQWTIKIIFIWRDEYHAVYRQFYFAGEIKYIVIIAPNNMAAMNYIFEELCELVRLL